MSSNGLIIQNKHFGGNIFCHNAEFVKDSVMHELREVSFFTGRGALEIFQVL